MSSILDRTLRALEGALPPGSFALSEEGGLVSKSGNVQLTVTPREWESDRWVVHVAVICAVDVPLSHDTVWAMVFESNEKMGNFYVLEMPDARPDVGVVCFGTQFLGPSLDYRRLRYAVVSVTQKAQNWTERLALSGTGALWAPLAPEPTNSSSERYPRGPLNETPVQYQRADIVPKVREWLDTLAEGWEEREEEKLKWYFRMGSSIVTITLAETPDDWGLAMEALVLVDAPMTEELGRALLRWNGTFTFGGFCIRKPPSMGGSVREIMYCYNVLAADLSYAEFSNALASVAVTADDWDDRLASQFGGSTVGERAGWA